MLSIDRKLIQAICNNGVPVWIALSCYTQDARMAKEFIPWTS